MPALLDDASHGVLLKEQLASALEQVIVTGRLHARHRVAETIWPQEFSLAQAPFREIPTFISRSRVRPATLCWPRSERNSSSRCCVYSDPRPHERARTGRLDWRPAESTSGAGHEPRGQSDSRRPVCTALYPDLRRIDLCSPGERRRIHGSSSQWSAVARTERVARRCLIRCASH